ncbi:MAG TPA: hypothetical protein VN902_10680 [Candidatus Acidoferrales bacterium]|nr:hypothetical protein [Candidatus Acidoferrales bacterium]
MAQVICDRRNKLKDELNLSAQPRSRVARPFHQVGERIGLPFLHHMAAICLHRNFADAELAADLLKQIN